MAHIRYYSLGPGKQLNQIVVAGSHDAGITGGAANVQTQDLNILEQARAGVRVFDIRITAVGSGSQALLKTYHGAPKDPAKESKRGAYGEGLTKILADARSFVTNPKYQNEFLILKFDKCSNWPDIASACVNLLGPNVIYPGTGNLNTKTLFDLKGRVVVLFTTDGYKAVRGQYPPGSGILRVRAISEKPYAAIGFHGMQYCGKGGTDWASNGSHQEKMQENYATQTGLMRTGLGQRSSPEVIGMMYWTSTGFLESIRDRNTEMWAGGKPGQVPAALKLMFKTGLKESLESRIASSVDPTTHAAGTLLKVFMPNIVMIDFADRHMCEKIFDLNRVSSTQITKAFQAVDQEVQQLQAMQAQLQRGGRVKL